MIQQCAISNWSNFLFRCGCAPVPLNIYLDVISTYFSIFKNVAYSLEPGETPTFFTIKKHLNRFDAAATRLRLLFQFIQIQHYSHAHYLIEFISGSGAVPVNWNAIVFSPRFAIFENVIQSLEPGETPIYSASHEAPNYVHRSQKSQNIIKRLRCGCGWFLIYLCSVLYKSGS